MLCAQGLTYVTELSIRRRPSESRQEGKTQPSFK